MSRKNESNQKAALRSAFGQFLRENDVTIKNSDDVNSIMKDMISLVLEGALDGEMDEHLGYSKYDYEGKNTGNSRNGYSKKTVHTSYGDTEIDVPRDRQGEFEPQILPKYSTVLSNDLEAKILSMYGKGMTTAEIEAHMKDTYGVEISDSSISRLTDKIMPIIKEWQERPLEEIYAVVYMDAIHFHVRSEGRIIKKAVYIALGIDLEGHKDVLGMYVGENESAKFWLSIMNGLKNRGVRDIFIACVDGLTGFPQAIEAVFPETEIQQCIIHQIRNSTKYVSYKDIKALMADLKLVYQAPTEEVRRLVYTTNTVEGFNRQLRKVTKSSTVFPTDDSLLKLLYLATEDITKKWTGRRQDWSRIGHSSIFTLRKDWHKRNLMWSYHLAPHEA